MSTTPIFSLPHRAGSIAAVDGSISPQAFRTNGYDANFGWPVILRGAARKSPAFERWATDAALLAAHSDARVSVELGKFDARTPSARSSMMLGQFLATTARTATWSPIVREASAGIWLCHRCSRAEAVCRT